MQVAWCAKGQIKGKLKKSAGVSIIVITNTLVQIVDSLAIDIYSYNQLQKRRKNKVCPWLYWTIVTIKFTVKAKFFQSSIFYEPIFLPEQLQENEENKLAFK